jgi:hypothetical protein
MAQHPNTLHSGCDTLMRHFFFADPRSSARAIAALAFGMKTPTVIRLLVQTPGRAL